ncbi:hypothetical protein BC940DRAFT_301050 [Gongronella butleri]|nr:hypothetical protein BC940DRAFT_301050 [Gongronella butleri]
MVRPALTPVSMMLSSASTRPTLLGGDARHGLGLASCTTLLSSRVAAYAAWCGWQRACWRVRRVSHVVRGNNLFYWSTLGERVGDERCWC